MSPIYGKWPAIVDSYDAAARMCRVRVPGITDGSNDLPFAEIEYPIGDRGDADEPKDRTELRILAGDKVYVEFLCGDPRFPLITGHRLMREGNPTEWRRWRHANIEMTADGDMVFNANRIIHNVKTDVISNIGGNQTTSVTGNRTETVSGDQKTDVTGSMESSAATSQHTSATHLLASNTTIAGSISTIAGVGGAVGMSIQGPVRMEGSTYEVVNMTVTYTGCTITSNGKSIDHTHVHTSHNDGDDTSTPH